MARLGGITGLQLPEINERYGAAISTVHHPPERNMWPLFYLNITQRIDQTEIRFFFWLVLLNRVWYSRPLTVSCIFVR